MEERKADALDVPERAKLRQALLREDAEAFDVAGVPDGEPEAVERPRDALPVPELLEDLERLFEGRAGEWVVPRRPRHVGDPAQSACNAALVPCLPVERQAI